MLHIKKYMIGERSLKLCIYDVQKGKGKVQCYTFKKHVHDLIFLIMEAEDDYVETPILLYKIANFI